MTFQVTVSPSGRQFECGADETVLAAALRVGLVLPHGCKNGACGACKGRILSGQTVLNKHQEKTLTPAEEQQGLSLFCCAKPQSDVTIEAREVEAGEFASKKLPTRIAKIEKLSHDVMLVCLQLPATEKFVYHAGQYIEFLLRDGKRRSYSMANAAHTSDQISLHIRHMPGGLFTDQVFSTLKERDILRIEGPQGTFYLREDSDKPMVLLASGTGFAPIKAIIEYVVEQKITRPMTLYWGGRRPADLYMHQLCLDWAANIPNFSYVPVVSDATPEDNWIGRNGFVHRAVLDDFSDLSGVQVYACGAPIVVDSAKRDFVALAKLPVEEFYADSFISEADLA
ncbi:CDP-6-deoxy-delta-3,4-glucoseen reductase [Solimicrobium silvestre]|uniref:Oxidoreductase FAD-binding domain n=1 Tax=Solimicrobium silvestre TaxID=2099400 RepID=A0A2S9GWB6_9BURK|nr:CDP-6-deoxy-delta-3,4-glucoseen reductase [Solimicrobium silvestre]PRC92013.1 Oxidoreductase FAD-binding domain [Solimicrobium silvestre]